MYVKVKLSVYCTEASFIVRTHTYYTYEQECNLTQNEPNQIALAALFLFIRSVHLSLISGEVFGFGKWKEEKKVDIKVEVDVPT